MAVYFATSAMETFPGTSGTDTLYYISSPSAVTLTFSTGIGMGGFAEYDMFGTDFGIERFFLSDFDDMLDATGATQRVDQFGEGGDDTLIGGDARDRIVGGTGNDSITGGAGDDRIEIFAGDSGAVGDYYDGGSDFDTVQLKSGGVGTTFDLSLSTFVDVEQIMMVAEGTVIFADDAHVNITVGSSAVENTVVIESWTDNTAAGIFSSVSTYLSKRFDVVEWTEDQGDVRAEINALTGNIQYTYDNNGIQSELYTTRTVEFDSSGAILTVFETTDDGVEYSAEFDPAGGAGNEVLLNEYFEDFGTVEFYESAYFEYAIDDVSDGILDYSWISYDDGVIVESGYENSILVSEITTDNSFDGLALDFEFQALLFNADGSPFTGYTLFDFGNPVGEIFSDFETGDDLFVLSGLSGDGIWGTLFSPAAGISTSSGALITAPVDGLIKIDSSFLGGAGFDRIEGSAMGEAILLYDVNFSSTTTASGLFDARVVGVEEFDMDAGDDVVNLTSSDSQLAYVTDVFIDGGAGNDNLFAAAGNDTIIGGTGEDRIVTGMGDNVVTGGEAGGTGDGVKDRFYFSAETGGGTTRITDFEAGTDQIIAIGYGVTGLASAITGGQVTVSTVGSDKVIEMTDGLQTTTVILEGYTGGVTGTDLIVFDDAAPLPPGFSSNAPITGDSGDNFLAGDGNNDTFIQTAGADLMEGLAGNDTFQLTSDIDGTWGALFTYAEGVETTGGALVSAALNGKVQILDTFIGGTDYDSILGTAADEALLLYEDSFSSANAMVSPSDVRILGVEMFDMGAGSDIVNLTSNDGQLGYATDVTIDGGMGDDFLFAGAGNDTLIGGGGVDRLVGWKGNDVMTGGTGEEDRFIFGADSGGGRDIITDFEVGVDTFYGIGYGVAGGAFAGMGAGVMTTTVVGGDTLVTLDDGNATTEVLLQGVTAIDANDFVFIA